MKIYFIRMKRLSFSAGLILIGNGVAGFIVINIAISNGLVGLLEIALIAIIQE